MNNGRVLIDAEEKSIVKSEQWFIIKYSLFISFETMTDNHEENKNEEGKHSVPLIQALNAPPSLISLV